MNWNYNIGDRVQLVTVPAKYSGPDWPDLTGARGRVEANSGGTLAVSLLGYTNPNSGKGRFYFDTCHLMPEDFEMKKEETPMTFDQNIPMLPGFHVAGVRMRPGEKGYAFAMYDPFVIGDTVVVRLSSGNLVVGELVSVDELDREQVKNHCEVIAAIDMRASEDRYERAKKMAELKKEMDARIEKLQETALYELMAEKDPELKALLEKFKSLEA